MKPVIEFDGRRYIQLTNAYWRTMGKPYLKLHQEVWKKERGPIPPRWHVHHKDRNPSNNNIENLECLSPEEHNRIHHKGKIGLRGEKQGGAKLTDLQARAIRALYQPRRYSIYRLADEFGVSPACISNIICNKTFVQEAPVRKPLPTHCKLGHPYHDYPSRKRRCPTCNDEARRKRRAQGKRN